jgi:hypothetical protein
LVEPSEKHVGLAYAKLKSLLEVIDLE